MIESTPFDYNTAFNRNIGWITNWEQHILRSKKVAIAGMGGVGGIHFLTLARLGIENFHIADLDNFELANFNRQIGASVSTLKKSKVETLTAMANDINPNIHMTCFPQGVSKENINDFLKDVDLYMDGLDFFVLEVRQKIFKRCHELQIPVVTAAPLGMSVAYQVFMPNKMSFDEYYNFDPKTPELNQVKFLLGLNPSAGHRLYLADPSAINFKENRGPSTIIACNLCAGVAAAEALKILLNRGQVFAAPWVQCFDAYRNIYTKRYLRGGNHNFIQKIRIWIANKQINKFTHIQKPQESSFVPQNDLQTILNLAKWTPSGDNSQPWQFEIQNANEFILHVHNENSVYDFANKPSILTIGFFIENFKIAASHIGYRAEWTYQPMDHKTHKVHFNITKDDSIKENVLFPFLKIRSTNRFSYKTRALTQKQKAILEESLGEHFKIHWFESFSQRLRIAQLNAQATYIRLSIPEAYSTHKGMMDLKNNFSPTGVPLKAAGVSPIVQRLLAFQIKSWRRINFLNKFLAGAIVPQLEMDFLPGINCAAHYIVEWKNPESANNIQTLLTTGQALQRFWLELTRMGLMMQPSMAPIAFAYYGKNKIPFTKSTFIQHQARKITQQLGQIAPVENILFIGRVGTPKTTLEQPRSIRKDLQQLIKS